MITGTQHFIDDIYAIDWSMNEKYIIVADHKAKVHLLKSEDLSILDTFQTSFQQKDKLSQPWVEEIKFSSNGEYIALGTHGGQPNI